MRDTGRRSLPAALALAAIVLPVRSGAFIGGMTGFSGIVRPDGGAPLCNKCHGGGVAPVARLEGPPTVEPGEAAAFRLVLESASAEQTAGGLDVAVTGGELEGIAGEGEQIVENELTHTAPKPGVDGEVVWRFLWTAPRAPGLYTLYAAGNSVNADATAGGDAAARATRGVVVPGETFTPAPTRTATPTPTASPSRTSTPTRTPSPCAGDCNRDQRVMVDELVRVVRAALGSASIDECTAFDPSRDGTVSLNEVVEAVRHALDGCD